MTSIMNVFMGTCISVSFVAFTPLSATAQETGKVKVDDRAFFDLILDRYKEAVPTAKVEDIPAIFSEDRSNTIKKVNDCVSKIDGFTGLVIRHEPEYLVAVKFIDQAKKNLKSCTENSMFLGILALRSNKELENINTQISKQLSACLLYTSPSPRDRQKSRMPSSA